MAHDLALYRSIGTKLIAAYVTTVTSFRIIDNQLWDELRAKLLQVSQAIPEALEITVTCDASNNPPNVVDRPDVVAEVYIRVTEDLGAHFELSTSGCSVTSWKFPPYL
jgi:hypothetical protein